MPETIAAFASGLTLVLLIMALGLAFWMVARTADAVARVERKRGALLKHSGLDIATIGGQEAQVLVRAGRKMEAIKLYREYPGVGLAEAKAAVERLQ
jgi:ribosomal protein L7/L12